MPFFYEPGVDTNLNVKIPRSLLPEGSEAEYPEDDSHFSYASFLFCKLPIYAEYRYTEPVNTSLNWISNFSKLVLLVLGM